MENENRRNEGKDQQGNEQQNQGQKQNQGQQQDQRRQPGNVGENERERKQA